MRRRLMVRYTQDSWKNDAPSIQANLWGDDPVPGRRLELGPAEQVVRRVAEPDARQHRDEHPPVLLFGEQDRDHARRRGSALNDAVTSTLLPIFPYSSKQYGAETGASGVLGRRGIPTLWNEAPFLNNQDLFIIKDDYTKVFGKHFVKAGVLASFNKKNEDTDGNGSSQHSRFWGSAGLRWLGLHHRQHPGRLPARAT